MSLTEESLDPMGDDLASRAVEISLHSADPGTTGANETTAGREVPTWSAAASKQFSLINVPLQFTGGASDGAVTHVGLWAAGDVFLGGTALAGEYSVDGLTVTGS
jgi:hypothetical protein